MATQQKKLGDILVDMGQISSAQLDEILQKQKQTGLKFGELLIQQNIMSEAQIIQVLEMQLGIPHVNLEMYYIEPEVPRLIAENLAKKHMLVPINRAKNKLIVAMTDPLNIFAIDDVRLATGLEISPVIATRRDIESVIERYYGQQSAERAAEDFRRQYDLEREDEIDIETENDVSNAPIVRLVNSVIKQAIRSNASDIHIEPYEESVRIRFRVDGDLQEIMTTSKTTHSGIVTRIKIMGKLDISERRLPQDGRFESIIDSRSIDMRISVIPTVHGEKVVIRLLDSSNFLTDMAQLGFSENNVKQLDKLIMSPNGIILVTGPTGSGKSTTLYSMLREFNSVSKNVITVEDPVEFKIDGITQVQANYKAGLDFAVGLRAILRQDPDVIMIGEIRDTETAQIAVRAAITGHIVLSTMHTNDAASAVTRLVDMGVDAYLVASAITGVVAQRLVKKICPRCRVAYSPSDEERRLMRVEGITALYKGEGCNYCNQTGYLGRTAVHEIMVVNKELRRLLSTDAEHETIRGESIKNGMMTLYGGIARLVLQGITTCDELIRVAYNIE